VKYLLFPIMLLALNKVYAQPHPLRQFKYGFKLAYTIHTITGGRAKTPNKLYGAGGLWLQLLLDKNWTCQTEILFVEKGTGGVKGKRPVFGDYWVKLYYFEVPILFQFHKKRMTLEFGPGIGLLMYQAEYLYFDYEPDLTGKYPFSKRELSLNAGIHFLLRKWHIGLRATHSLLPVRKQVPGISTPVYNRLLELAFTRPLNFKKKKKEVEE
jgi:hypothetical protein